MRRGRAGIVLAALLLLGCDDGPTVVVLPDGQQAQADIRQVLAAQTAHGAETGEWADGVDDLTAIDPALAGEPFALFADHPVDERHVSMEVLGTVLVLSSIQDGWCYYLRTELGQAPGVLELDETCQPHAAQRFGP